MANRPTRKLAPGVMKKVDSGRKAQETFSIHDNIELLAADAKFDWAKARTFARPVWALEFQFKPVRMLEVDIPQESGFMRKQLIWYMVYSVTNQKIEEKEVDIALQTQRADGLPMVKFTNPPIVPQFGWLVPGPIGDGSLRLQCTNRPIRFIPRFLLEGFQSVDAPPGENQVYPDRVIPLALKEIGLREDANRKFYSTAEICREKIVEGTTVWGIATWESVDPKIDRFSVYVEGLNNTFRWRDNPAALAGGRKIDVRTIFASKTFSRKTLKLNFWRPGDDEHEHEAEIRYGVPNRYGFDGDVDYEWIYR